ncbi:MAG: regulator [Alphaproteobacteria bacterium]
MSDYRFDDRNVTWRPFPGFEGLYYFVLDVDDDRQLVDMLMKFDPHATCVPHRHVGPTRTLVIDGEHRIIETDGETIRDRRPAATFSRNGGDETHIEGGGPDGAVILLSMTAVDGVIYEILDETASKIDRVITLADFKRGLEKQRRQAAA